MTSKSKIIYKSKDEITVKYLHTPVPEYLSYNSTVTIRDRGKNPVLIQLKFNGILPEFAEMPPKEHEINASTVIELYRKLNRWFRKYGYIFYAH